MMQISHYNLPSILYQARDDTAIATGGCPYQFGIYASAACSPSYVKCAFGVAEEHPCDVGTVYDDRIHACNWPDLVGTYSIGWVDLNLCRVSVKGLSYIKYPS